MKSYIALLPSELVLKIISYSYSPQSKELCQDVQSYKKTETYLKNIYREDFHDEEEAMGWLSNNICRFLNDDIATMYGYSPRFINIFRRPIQNKNKSDIEIARYIETITTILEEPLTNIDINVPISLMKPCERTQLINWLDNLR
mgnify:FL=1|tara:strand:+ start:913 stop:1344 length:432 start_codon:yes stop_codon:yes gene_type:complete